MIKRKCAFMNRECNSDCVAWVPTGSDDNSKYHFSFPCIRLDAAYDIACALTKIQENMDDRA
jgi:hypothetical protein